MPLALLGLREGQNLYLNAQGQWDARYVPAFVRRYPYILQGDANAQQMLVLVDAGAEGFDHEQGERLFNDDGSNTALMDQTIAMLHSFSQAAEYTAGLVRRLRELDLLTARSINAVTPDGEKIQLNGVFAVDEVRLNALGDADLLGLARNGYLAAIHAHMISLYNIDRLIARLPAAA